MPAPRIASTLKKPSPVPAFEWKTYDMGLPLIDLEDRDALYRILDEDD